MKDIELLLQEAIAGNQESTVEAIEQLSPLLKKYTRKLQYEDAFFDLQLKLLEVLHALKPQQGTMNIGQILAYIRKSIEHEYIRLSTQNERQPMLIEDLSKEQQYLIDAKLATVSIDTHAELHDLLKSLTLLEQTCLKRIVLQGDSAANLARELNCSRQSINQAKQRGLKKIQERLAEDK